MGKQLNHFNSEGKAIMADVSAKAETKRTALAEGHIAMNREAFTALAGGTAEKGDVLGAARIAGILAAKSTPQLIPLCHPLQIEHAGIDFVLQPENNRVLARCHIQCTGKTGAEMEALTGVSVALLTIYDMCKALDRSMQINAVQLVEKSGGASGHYTRGEPET